MKFRLHPKEMISYKILLSTILGLALICMRTHSWPALLPMTPGQKEGLARGNS